MQCDGGNIEAMDSGHAMRWMDALSLSVNSIDFTAYFSGLPHWDPQHTTAPTTLATFAEYLESHGVTDFTFVCHEVKIGSEEDVEAPLTIKSTEKCSFEPTPLPPKSQPTVGNFGSNIPRSKIDWSTGKASGNKCVVHFHMSYSDNVQLKGIKPEKPAVFLMGPCTSKRGMCMPSSGEWEQCPLFSFISPSPVLSPGESEFSGRHSHTWERERQRE